MRYATDLREAEFLSRENRFAARVRYAGDDHLVHVPNSGRMHELLVPGATVLLAKGKGQERGQKKCAQLMSAHVIALLLDLTSIALLQIHLVIQR